MNRTNNKRIWEIDFLRGIALILMIIFHLVYDLKEFFEYNLSYNQGVYMYIGKISGSLFILISAVSCSFSRNNFKRAGKFLGVAVIITLVSSMHNPAYSIKFGIMHFLGMSILLYPVLAKQNKYLLAILGTAIIGLGQYFGPIPATNNYLFLFNLTSTTWVSTDYYPLFPWFGVFIYGIILGKVFYSWNEGLNSRVYRNNIIVFLGRHTLVVYLIHQPLLLLMISVIKKNIG